MAISFHPGSIMMAVCRQAKGPEVRPLRLHVAPEVFRLLRLAIGAFFGTLRGAVLVLVHLFLHTL